VGDAGYPGRAPPSRAGYAGDRGEVPPSVYRASAGPRPGSPGDPSGRAAAMRSGMHVPPATHVPYARSGTPSFTELGDDGVYRGAPGGAPPEGALPRTGLEDPRAAGTGGAVPGRGQDRLLALEDDTRHLRQRVGDIEQHMEEDSTRRDEQFEEKESERDGRFQESERRRDEEAEQRHADIWNDLEERLRSLPPPGELHVPPADSVPSAPGTTVGGGVPTTAPTLPVPPPPHIPHIRPLSRSTFSERSDLIEPVRDAAIHAASIYSRDIRGIIDEERDLAARERERAAQELSDVHAELERKNAEIVTMQSRRIEELEAELERCREECDRERSMRTEEEAVRRGQDAEEARARDEAFRQQLEDITNLLQRQQEDYANKRELTEQRWADDDDYRQRKSSQWEELMIIVQNILNGQGDDRNKLDEYITEQGERMHSLSDLVKNQGDVVTAAINDMNIGMHFLIALLDLWAHASQRSRK
jgi:hypothetical protein